MPLLNNLVDHITGNLIFTLQELELPVAEFLHFTTQMLISVLNLMFPALLGTNESEQTIVSVSAYLGVSIF